MLIKNLVLVPRGIEVLDVGEQVSASQLLFGRIYKSVGNLRGLRS
jgi:hypothetical protein